MRKPVFCICENKDADQLRGNREADQRLCFHYTDSTIPPKSESFDCFSHNEAHMKAAVMQLLSLISIFVGPCTVSEIPSLQLFLNFIVAEQVGWCLTQLMNPNDRFSCDDTCLM